MRLLTISLLLVAANAQKFDDCDQKPKALTTGHRVGGKLYSNQLDYYHQKALPYSPIYAFTDVFLKINLTDADSYHFYQGSNCSAVKQLYDNDNRYFGLWKKAALLRSHHLDPFNDTIVGVHTAEPYEISVLVWKVNYVRVGVYAAAILLFLLASKLVRNVVFYYTSGCSFGLLASLLLVAFIVWRVAPKKTIGLPILIGGWSVSIYMLHFAWSNLQSILFEYQKYVIGYFSAVLLVSMAVCYKRGPPTDARSHDIAQWSLQLIALALIYFSVQLLEVSLGTIAVLVLQELTRGFLFAGIRWYFVGLAAFWRKCFPKKRRLLNEAEYEKEGENTTREQLALLREYCRKEGNHPWKLAGNVRSARRLARFVEGEEDHITEDEAYAHEISGDILERDEEYENDFYVKEQRTPNGSLFEHEEDDGEEDQWDEIVVRRSGASERVQSIRVPRKVSERLLSPYRQLNRTVGASMGYERGGWQPRSSYSEHRPRRDEAPRTGGRLTEFLRGKNVLQAEPQRYASSSSGSSSRSNGMTPSEYMRQARRMDGLSRTPTRRVPVRQPTTDEEEYDE
ncbi:unnamed protein product [Caenorhabditis sp. 36 PRJEB53466]|nr:unnamed protein product [Caenorhabditis sp. 36 PRJEB53466]